MGKLLDGFFVNIHNKSPSNLDKILV